MWNNVVQLFQNYMGTGLIVVWFLVCLVYLFLEEKDKGRRILFLYVPVILFLLFFNPLFMQVVYGFIGAEIYYRILWLMPITIVIAYTIVSLMQRLAGAKRVGMLVVSLALILVSGKCIYRNPFFAKADNLYHMPQAVVNICDEIKVEGREVMAVFPQELIPFVRQYSAVVCMPYGREMLVARWNFENALFDAMEAPVLEAEKIAILAREQSCHYVIVREQQEVQGDFEDYEYVEFLRTEGYVVYLDTTAYLGLEWDRKKGVGS